MTRQRDFDELIHTFVNEGPAELSPRLIGSIRDEIHGTRQRTLWRPWRTSSMPRPFLVFAVLGAIVLAFGAFLLVGPGGRVNAPPSPAPVTSPSPSPTPLFTPSPSFSPYPLADGEAWIVLEAGDTGNTMIRPDGTGSHEILGGMSVRAVTAGWSPDGQQIVFEGNGDRGSQVWIANADGTGATQLTPTPDGCPHASCIEGIHPAWSPDGKSIAYIAVTHESGTFTKSAVAVLDIATGKTTELYAATDVLFGRPSWAPDNGRIAVEMLRYEGTPEVTNVTSSVVGVVAVTGTDHAPKDITNASLLAGYPGWHPTEDLIVVRTNRFDGNTQTLLDNKAASNLYTMRSDGSNTTAITQNRVGEAIVRAPSWTSDGRILFSKLADPADEEHLMLIKATGLGEVSATGDVVTLGEGRWRPVK